MDYFIPYYVNDVQSDIRGINCGWYTMDEHGKLGSGPFSSANECLGSGCFGSECLGIGAQENAPTLKWLH